MWDSWQLSVYPLKPHGVHIRRLGRGRRNPDSSANPGGVPLRALIRRVSGVSHASHLLGGARRTPHAPTRADLLDSRLPQVDRPLPSV
ncbi:unnamed protein product [Euphydryas editha]|uniref:Uncharacterized protein n=1 Tax=Euphydryas editha TaxID=104508 RepID=A0AAU9V2M6_EUPED|nr:unnamed protein product [Euphydryas editha]